MGFACLLRCWVWVGCSAVAKIIVLMSTNHDKKVILRRAHSLSYNGKTDPLAKDQLGFG